MAAAIQYGNEWSAVSRDSGRYLCESKKDIAGPGDCCNNNFFYFIMFDIVVNYGLSMLR